jgi:signal transduction histidine kinase/CheY-like chemotaxis protein
MIVSLPVLIVALVVAGAGGTAIGWLLVVRQTARAKGMAASLEEQVRERTAELSEARDRAEREARLKSGFLAAMSHEIRTPMNSIVGMADLMAETALDAEQREYCDVIRTSTDALLGVLNDILDFSKIESQGVTLEILDFDLRLVIEDAVELLAVKAGAVGLDLAALFEPGFDGRFRGDPSRLRQVVVNLVGNAVKFTRTGSVTVRVATLVHGDASTRIRVEVVDTGIGMTPDGIARLFRPFSQAEDSTTRQYGGTGLGLTISKQIVERMGGAIGVTSEPGHGSTFWIEVPFERGAAAPQPPASGAEGRRALLVDPLDASAEALGRLLAEQGIGSTRARTGADGVEALHAQGSGYDLVFVNVDAEAIDALAGALAHERSSAQTAFTVIAPTGRRALAVELVPGRPAHHLTRPVRRARLVECLQAIAAEGPPAPQPDPVAPLPRSVGTASAPADTAAAAASTSADAAPAVTGRVLVADDYPANQRLVARLLERRGYTVTLVADGLAAAEAALAQPFDVILMDCSMPIADGYEATARIRGLEQGRRTPIVAMTAHDSPEDRAACLDAGMDDYLVKPIQAALVLDTIARWIALGRETAAAAPTGDRS